MGQRSLLYRFDDLRRFATALAAGAGITPARASAFVTGLLWFDAADAAPFGIASLPGWLDLIDRGKVDPASVGKIVQETAGVAVLDARRAIGPLALARAAEVAQEKAREIGVGVVRVADLGPLGPAASVASALALGPTVGLILGPGGAFAMAVPVLETVPAVYDSALAVGSGPADAPGWAALTLPAWAWPTVAGEGWIVSAYSVKAIGTLDVFHARVASLLEGSPARPGEVRPDAWRRRRGEAIERGVLLPELLKTDFDRWAKRRGIVPPEPIPAR